MKFLFIMDPLAGVSVDADTTFALMLAAQERGHEPWYCGAGELWVDSGKAWARAARAELGPVQGEHFTLDEHQELPLSTFEAVWMRKDPPFDVDYVFATYPLDVAGTLVVNRPQGLRNANEKMYITLFPDLTPRTLVSQDAARIRRFVQEVGGRAVVKPLDGMGGLGVMLLSEDSGNVGAILEVLTHVGRRLVMVQQYIPEATTGDARILLMDGEVLGGILRVPRPGDHRANIHVGATVVAHELSDDDRRICTAIAPRLRADGLYFVGIDTIGGLLSEVNVTSPTGIQELARLSGGDPCGKVIDWLEAHPFGEGLPWCATYDGR